MDFIKIQLSYCHRFPFKIKTNLKLKKIILTLFFSLTIFKNFNGQSTLSFADSIRKHYKIPELGYAVITSNKVLELNTIGIKKINTSLKAEINDKFRIGSNTKAITGFIAAQLVKQKKINWDTKFFDLFPELKSKSHQSYHNLTLINLLTFRSKLFPYTYTYNEPKQDQFSGNEQEQRYQFTTWFLQQKPIKSKDSINFSNLGYIAAGQMLEKATGKSYKDLVTELGQLLGVNFGFGNPNSNDTSQPWGHDKYLNPESPEENYKLNWLLPAGNINVSLPDYVKFIQLQLKGLLGLSELMSKDEFNFLHFGFTKFSVGWFSSIDQNNQAFSYNIGNPGTFLSKVYVFKNFDKAFILFANAQTIDADTGLNILFNELKRKYNK